MRPRAVVRREAMPGQTRAPMQDRIQEATQETQSSHLEESVALVLETAHLHPVVHA